MEMTIDESNRILVDRYIDTYVVCGGWNYNPTINITREDYEAFKVAIHTMRKYQKIEQIIRNYDIAWEFHHMKPTIDEIRKVVEDGKID